MCVPRVGKGFYINNASGSVAIWYPPRYLHNKPAALARLGSFCISEAIRDSGFMP